MISATGDAVGATVGLGPAHPPALANCADFIGNCTADCKHHKHLPMASFALDTTLRQRWSGTSKTRQTYPNQTDNNCVLHLVDLSCVWPTLCDFSFDKWLQIRNLPARYVCHSVAPNRAALLIGSFILAGCVIYTLH